MDYLSSRQSIGHWYKYFRKGGFSVFRCSPVIKPPVPWKMALSKWPVVGPERICCETFRALEVPRNERSVAVTNGNGIRNLVAGNADCIAAHTESPALLAGTARGGADDGLGGMEHPVFAGDFEALDLAVDEAVGSVIEEESCRGAVNNHLLEDRTLARIAEAVGFAQGKHSETLSYRLLLRRMYILVLIVIYEIVSASKAGLRNQVCSFQLLAAEIGGHQLITFVVMVRRNLDKIKRQGSDLELFLP